MAKDKYLTRLAQVSDYSACTPDEDYWQKIVDDVSIRVLLGKAPKVGAGLSIGIRLLALPASGWQVVRKISLIP